MSGPPAEAPAPEAPTGIDHDPSSPLSGERVPDCGFVIFGGTGDLAHRKLLPAVYTLDRDGLLPESLFILTYARREKSESDYRKDVRESLKQFAREHDAKSADAFVHRLYYQQGEYDAVDDFKKLEARLSALEKERKTCGGRVYYTSTPPEVFHDIIHGIRAVGLARSRDDADDGPWRRIVIEKPFGTDLNSARTLNRLIHHVFDEEQVYRIDHYLGKETVQNILVFRFANSLFEPLWNYKYIDHVQITVAETVGVEMRAGYFDQSGEIRDMIQSHVLQVLTLIAMESPVALDADAIRDEKVKVLRALRMPGPDDLALGQYASGTLHTERVHGYLEEDGVPANSRTETYAALRLYVDNLRWAGVPFYVRAGKRLPARYTEVAIQFRAQPEVLYSRLDCHGTPPNTLVLRIQPDEGMDLLLSAKVPGNTMRVAPVRLKFLYREAFHGVEHDAYERLLLDVMRGDAALFARADEVEAAWERVTPLLAYREQGDRPQPYFAGTDGPASADLLLRSSGRAWRPLGNDDGRG